MEGKKAIVVGAGLSGAAAARTLADRGFSVQVYEKTEKLAGNCYDEPDENGIIIQRYGPHIFHTKNKEVWDFCNRFAKFNLFQHKVLSFVEGRLLNFPINRDTLCDLYGIDIDISETENFLKRQVSKPSIEKIDESFESKVISQVGVYLYELFFKNYTLKQWGTSPSQLSSSLAGRIPVRYTRENRYFTDKYQGLPEKGFTEMIRKMMEHPNIELLLKTESDRYQNIPSDVVVYTGKLDQFFDFTFGELSYRSVHFEFETLDQEQFQPVSVVNYPNDYDFTRITEFKHFYNTRSEKTVILKEYPSETGIPCYVVPDYKNEQLKSKYYVLKNNLENEGRYIFTGRLAEYKYYNMDQAVEAVFDKINRWFDRFGSIQPPA